MTVATTYTIELSHEELSLLLFALEGHKPALEPPTCEDSCPVVSHFEAALGGDSGSPEKRIAHHLNDHIRDGLFECGVLELMNRLNLESTASASNEVETALRQANARLRDWSCVVGLEDNELHMLRDAFSRLPKSAWISMPRTLWRLKKKLRHARYYRS